LPFRHPHCCDALNSAKLDQQYCCREFEMPIYEYRCGDCGQHKDYLQKISDAPLDTCPACGSKSYAKALTAAGFQLKGNGWYATDFKGGSGGPAKTATSSEGDGKVAEPSTKTDSSIKAESTSSAAPAACSPGCACH
jgi:putative FmdB family regulatory protein